MIKNRRKAAKLTQQEVADKIGMDRRTFQRKEEKEDLFTIAEMRKLGQVLGFSIYLIDEKIQESITKL